MDSDVLHESDGDSVNPIMLNVQSLHGRHWICCKLGDGQSRDDKNILNFPWRAKHKQKGRHLSNLTQSARNHKCFS